jgi:hypothetical protein
MKTPKTRHYTISVKPDGKFVTISPLFPSLMDRIHVERARELLGADLHPGLYRFKVQRIRLSFKFKYHYTRML